MARKVTMGRLRDFASNNGIEYEGLSYEELREKVDIKECRKCRREYLVGYNDTFCSDSCEVEYNNENF